MAPKRLEKVYETYGNIMEYHLGVTDKWWVFQCYGTKKIEKVCETCICNGILGITTNHSGYIVE